MTDEIEQAEQDILEMAAAGLPMRLQDSPQVIAAARHAIIRPLNVGVMFSGRCVFKHLADMGGVYRRWNSVVTVDEKNLRFSAISKHRFCSVVEKPGLPVHAVTLRTGRNGREELRFKESHLLVSEAELLLANDEGIEQLSNVEIISQFPFLHRRGTELVELQPGYNPDAEVFVCSDQPLAAVQWERAVADLKNLYRDFKFTTPSDFSRAIAMLLTPALRRGRLLDGPFPLGCVLADQSQAGKGELVNVTVLVWTGKPPPKSTNKDDDNGVGSFEERLGDAIFRAAEFYVIDNVRGHIASQSLESAITEGELQVRMAFKPLRTVDISMLSGFMTSNGMSATPDLVNRMCMSTLEKQPSDYTFHAWPEGSLRNHVTQNQHHYLSCVYSVIREWWARGAPRLPVSTYDHDMTRWGGAIEYMVQELFGLHSALKGHGKTKETVRDASQSWLRQVFNALKQEGQLCRVVRASEILEVCEAYSLDVTTKQDADDVAKVRTIGRKIGPAFKKNDVTQVRTSSLTCDEVNVENFWVYRHAVGDTKFYVFSADQLEPGMIVAYFHEGGVVTPIDRKY
ncbi:hypothetical protein FV139_00555 [Parahaliea maris]|uniref:Uncharacterized protein n=1 Tax=Parahaliea maris TaxID=2716870 RepID=A0A5C9A7N0_9GAMM|nr:hypothetical protein [Parahaliea maris]TXS96032.1 hypothetical protein FV139_00555 [Parahaliea maris]